jgi:SulP family sulfate permease
MSGDRHKSNRELLAQGAANILSPIFGGMPATGVIARTGTNILSGARTRMAGFSHAVIVLLIILMAAKRWPRPRCNFTSIPTSACF